MSRTIEADFFPQAFEAITEQAKSVTELESVTPLSECKSSEVVRGRGFEPLTPTVSR